MPKLTVRDFTEYDSPAQDAYFGGAGDAELLLMGVDPALIQQRPHGDPSRFRRVLETPVRERSVHSFAIDLDHKLIGGVTLKRINHGHWCDLHGHIYNPELRGMRYGTQILVESVDRAFQIYDLEKIVCEPSVGNAGPNKLLQSVGLKIIESYAMPAEGILLARTANRYEIERAWFYKNLRPRFL